MIELFKIKIFIRNRYRRYRIIFDLLKNVFKKLNKKKTLTISTYLFNYHLGMI